MFIHMTIKHSKTVAKIFQGTNSGKINVNSYTKPMKNGSLGLKPQTKTNPNVNQFMFTIAINREQQQICRTVRSSFIERQVC